MVMFGNKITGVVLFCCLTLVGKTTFATVEDHLPARFLPEGTILSRPADKKPLPLLARTERTLLDSGLEGVYFYHDAVMYERELSDKTKLFLVNVEVTNGEYVISLKSAGGLELTLKKSTDKSFSVGDLKKVFDVKQPQPIVLE